MKSILVIETPIDCIKCPCWNGEYEECQATGKISNEYLFDNYGFGQAVVVIPKWCPLKPLPVKQDTKTAIGIDLIDDLKFGHLQREAYKIGWNACLEEIEK